MLVSSSVAVYAESYCLPNKENPHLRLGILKQRFQSASETELSLITVYHNNYPQANALQIPFTNPQIRRPNGTG